MRADARADARELSLAQTGHMISCIRSFASALASALVHPLSCIRSRIHSQFSCDLSEPITCAKLVSALASAPENPLSHPLLHPLSCIRSHLSCDLSEPIRFAKLRADARERMREGILAKLNQIDQMCHKSLTSCWILSLLYYCLFNFSIRYIGFW